MKLSTNYSEMTDQQLLEELQHRVETFYDTLGGHEGGELQCIYKNKSMCLLDINENGTIDLSRFSGTGKINARVEKDDLEYREILLYMLVSPFVVYNDGSSPEEEDQEIRLEDVECSTCQDNIEKGKPIIQGHLEIIDDDRTPEEWAKDVEDMIMHLTDNQARINQLKSYVEAAINLDDPMWKAKADALEAVLKGKTFLIDVNKEKE